MRRALPIVLLAAVVLIGGSYPAHVRAAEDGRSRDLTAPITYVSGKRLYVDVGSGDGLVAGAEAVILRGDVDLGRARVTSVSSSSAALEVVRLFGNEVPRPGDRIALRVVLPSGAGEATDETAAEGAPDTTFVPLLAPTEPLAARTGAANVAHGWIEAGFDVRRSDVDGRDESRFRLSTGGSIERLAGRAWSVEWDVDWYRRGGDDGDDSFDGEVQVDQFVLRRHFGDSGVIGFGRIQPLALPSVGLVDGAYGEIEAAPGLRLGIVGGARPDLEDLGLSSDEYAVAPYVTFETGSYERVRLWTSAGFLATWFDGDSDRQAVLVDARLDLTRRYSIQVTSEIDIYDGDEAVRSGTRVTRFGAHAYAHLHDLFRPWIDIRDIEPADTLRLASTVDDPTVLLDGGYRRSTVGVRHDLGGGWSLEESVSRTDSDETDDDLAFEIRGARSGLFGIHSARADLAVYEIVGADSDGIGLSGSFSAMPVDSLYLRLGYVHSEIDVDSAGDPSFSTSTVTFDADWYATSSVSVGARLDHSFADDDASSLGVWLRWRW